MDYGIFNVHTDVDAGNCAEGCMDTARESALKVDSRRKIPCGTGESNLHWRCAGSMLYQLRYIPTPWRPHLMNIPYTTSKAFLVILCGK